MKKAIVFLRRSKSARPERTHREFSGRENAIFFCAGYNAAMRDMDKAVRAILLDERGETLWP